MLVTLIAQFTAKAKNSEKAVSFLSLMSCSMNKFKSRKFSHVNILFSDFTRKKNFFTPGNGGGGVGEGEGGGGAGVFLPPLFLRACNISSLT